MYIFHNGQLYEVTPNDFLPMLEEMIDAAVAEFGLSSERTPKKPGQVRRKIWKGDKKKFIDLLYFEIHRDGDALHATGQTFSSHEEADTEFGVLFLNLGFAIRQVMSDIKTLGERLP